MYHGSTADPQGLCVPEANQQHCGAFGTCSSCSAMIWVSWLFNPKLEERLNPCVMHTPPARRLALSTCSVQKSRNALHLPQSHCSAVVCCALLLQDQQAMQTIADYFQHPIPEVPWNNEDEFISVLNKAGLTDQT